ncbi:transcriptional regulator [Lactococcus hodotermopsidis]|uniref:Transcriptional regulator n=1 Tax=Pseudolactococcus hodotermopsidis TaxID=2709157 RepID=A0A6A0BEX4_9LACT|nr:BlaI/MecI/CopY family transcriptional regulator [Lactococcus hodotermopsidis]GFH43253.1 transcriptional regulator [Lactococcus hodotermopsidis]
MKANISNSEMVVMRAIWTLNATAISPTVAEISCKIADSNNWSVATIKTLLGRLVKKDMLATMKSGRKFIYSPTLTESQAISLMGKELLSKVCAQKHAKVIVDLIRASAFTATDLAMISQALTTKKAVCHVTCDCLENVSSCTCDCKHTENNELMETN